MTAYILAQAGSGFYFPPLHPIFVNFTAGLIPISFFFDALAMLLKKDSLRATAWWTFLAAALITPVTAALGWIWMDSMGGVDHWAMPWHMWIGIGATIAVLLMAIWRGWRYWKHTGPGWPYAGAALILLFALMVQGDLGGVMSLGSGVVFRMHQPSIQSVTGSSREGQIEWKTHLEVSK